MLQSNKLVKNIEKIKLYVIIINITKSQMAPSFSGGSHSGLNLAETLRSKY